MFYSMRTVTAVLFFMIYIISVLYNLVNNFSCGGHYDSPSTCGVQCVYFYFRGSLYLISLLIIVYL